MFGERPVPPFAVAIRLGSRDSSRQVWPKETVVSKLPFQPPAAKSTACAAFGARIAATRADNGRESDLVMWFPRARTGRKLAQGYNSVLALHCKTQSLINCG